MTTLRHCFVPVKTRPRARDSHIGHAGNPNTDFPTKFTHLLINKKGRIPGIVCGHSSVVLHRWCDKIRSESRIEHDDLVSRRLRFVVAPREERNRRVARNNLIIYCMAGSCKLPTSTLSARIEKARAATRRESRCKHGREACARRAGQSNPLKVGLPRTPVWLYRYMAI